MEELRSKLSRLVELIKAIKAGSVGPTIPTIPPIKPVSMPSINSKSYKPTKIPGIAPDSKKDPKKVAEQIKDGHFSRKTQKIMFKCDQWSDEHIKKMDEEAHSFKYHIHDGSYRITSKPLSIEEIHKLYGGPMKLESAGFRLIRHEPKVKQDTEDR